MDVLILAGGQGLRLWPLSQKSYPKQFLSLGEGASLFTETLIRFSSPFFQRIYIATNRRYKRIIEKQIPQHMRDKCTVIIEPESRNTMAALAYVLAFLREQKIAVSSLFITPSDHFLSPIQELEKAVVSLEKQLPKDTIGLLGAAPLYPETDYGYIELKHALSYEGSFFSVEKFHEKPSLKNAKNYLASKTYLWNTGMILLPVAYCYHLMEKHTPLLYKGVLQGTKALEAAFTSFSSQSIDCALLEKNVSLIVKRLDCYWSDVGSWDRLYDALQKDENQNILQGNVHAENSSSCLIFAKDKPIYTLGVENLVIVDAENCFFIAEKKQGAHRKKNRLFPKNSENIPV